MKVCFNFLFLFILAVSCKSSKTITNSDGLAYFVRHAEKADDGSKDPPLSLEGKARAEKLAEMLEGKDISAIYSTNYIRTKSTAQPLADKLGLKVSVYLPDDEQFIEEIRQKVGKESILVVGHSNTTPMLVNRIIGDEKYEQIKDSDYENIFVISKKKELLIAKREGFK